MKLSNKKMKNEITVKVAANITYSGITYNTPLIIEYKHTGVQYFKGKASYTTNKDIAERWKAKGEKVIVKDGYYFIKRLAIPTINANGEKGIWYINNDGDSYSINKVSKFAKKIHNQLSNNINPFN
jgi:hypothetical protein